MYHYTDAAGLHGILTSKRVWVTDCRFLNDETESQLGVRRVRDAVRNLYLKEDSPRKRQIYRRYLEILRSDRTDRNFIFSLSSRKDDLSQWRMYARDGQGFTIGFDTNKLFEIGKKTETFGFAKVSYNKALFDKRAKAVIDSIEPFLLKEENESSRFVELLEEAAVNFEWITTSYSVLFKHSSFMAEREWRVNTYRFDEEESHRVKVRPYGNRLVPYLELKLCEEGEECLPITRVGIGPGFRQSSTRYAVERLLEMTGTEAEIYDADTPFRRL